MGGEEGSCGPVGAEGTKIVLSQFSGAVKRD